MTAAINFRPTGMRIADGIVCFDGHHETSESEKSAERIARELIPWRKGPFKLGNLLLDTEWRSDKKWDRLFPKDLDLQGKVVADVGCNNGYYLFRIADAGAAKVIGYDPTQKYKQQYDLLAAHAPTLPIEFCVEGWQALGPLEDFYDVIFLMGINYHDPEPMNIFHACKKALKPDGLFICESVVVPHPENLTIYPGGKYTGIGGVYGIPTTHALMDQLLLCGFKNVYTQHVTQLTAEEQRATEFSPQKSLKDFLRPNGCSIDGYPPLYRGAVFARKG